MLTTLKYKTKDRKVFASSDFHWGHQQEFIWKKRGFNSVQEHGAYVVNKINERVGENDVLIYLGDVSLNSNRIEVEAFFECIKCQNIVYVSGNHESNMKAIYKETKSKNVYIEGTEDFVIYPLRYKNIIFVGEILNLTVDKQTIICCHYPLASWNYMKYESWMLHGHEHNSTPRSGKILDVGIDGYPNLLSFEEIKEIMDKKGLVNIGHH